MARLLSILLLGSVAFASQASAQALDNYFRRDRNISVLERPRPGYQALGMRLGSFMAYPKIELGVESDDNIYGVASGQHSDAIGLVAPEIDLMSNWNRNSVMLYARSASRLYSKYTDESTTDWQLGTADRIDAGQNTINITGDYGYLEEPRTSTQTSTSSKHPIEYYLGDVGGNLVHTFNRVRLTGGVLFQNYDYQNGTMPNGTQVFEKDRDHSATTFTGRGEYALSPDTAVFVEGTYNTQNYTLSPPTVALNRNATGETFSVGANFDVSQLVRGEVEVGYLSQDYAAKGFSSSTGASVKAKVDWFPTQLTTVTFSGGRAIAPSAAANSPAYVASTASGEVDHELLRNVILIGSLSWEQDDYAGVDRHDTIPTAHVGANYLLNQHVGVGLSYDYHALSSSGKLAGPHFDDNVIKLSSTLQY